MSVLDVAVHGSVAFVTMNRPEKLNAINPEMMVRLADAWSRIRDDSAIRASVITGAGDRAFSSGGDMKTLLPLLSRMRDPQDEWEERIRSRQREIVNTAMLRIPDYPKPIVAAVNGLCLAGGMELLLSTDVRVAVPHATFGLTEVQRGLIPGGGSVARLPRQVAQTVAMEMLLVGRTLGAERAYQVGLINDLADAGDLQRAARSMAERLARNGPLAVAAIKSVALRSSGISLEEAFALEDEAARLVLGSADAREGIQAFRDKREPRFSGT